MPIIMMLIMTIVSPSKYQYMYLHIKPDTHVPETTRNSRMYLAAVGTLTFPYCIGYCIMQIICGRKLLQF